MLCFEETRGMMMNILLGLHQRNNVSCLSDVRVTKKASAKKKKAELSKSIEQQLNIISESRDDMITVKVKVKVNILNIFINISHLSELIRNSRRND